MHAHGGPEVLRYEDAPDPVPQPGEVLVRVRACALNHLDVWARLGQAGRPVPLPHILGNDVAGEIAALGVPVPGLRPGQRVMLSPGVSCGRCRMCLAGEDSSCREYRILGYQLPGGYAELVRCPAANVIPLPDGISFEDAAALFFAGRLRSVVHAVLPLAEARRAHEMMEASEHFGKIVLRV